MNALARGIDGALNGNDCLRECKRWGFSLLVFPFGETPENRINYICNGERENMIIAMKEFIARNEGRFFETKEKH